MDNAGGYEENAFVAEFYDQVWPYCDRQNVGFFVEAARRPGGPVLEIGCGTGRALIPTGQVAGGSGDQLAGKLLHGKPTPFRCVGRANTAKPTQTTRGP